MYIDGNTGFDFASSKTDAYYSTKQDVAINKILNIDKNIFVIKKTEFEIHPYAAFQNDQGMYNITIFSKNIDAEISKFSNYLKSHNMKADIHVNVDSTNPSQNEYFSIVYQLSLLSCIAYLIVLITVLIKENKRIHIYKLHGYSSFRIATSMFFKRMGISCFIFSICLIFLTFLKIYPIDIAATVFLTNMKNMIEFFLAIHVVIFCLSVLYISFYVKSILTTNNHFMKSVIKFNYLLKVVFICVIMGTSITSFHTTLVLSTRWFDSKYMNHENDYARVLSASEDVLRNHDIIKELLANRNVSFCDFSKSEMDIYFPDKHFDPLIIVNDTYLEDYTVYDVDDKEIDARQFQEDTVLIPEKYKDKETQVGYSIGYLNTIYIKNNQTFYSLDPSATYLKLRSPIVVVKNDKNLTGLDIFDCYMKLDQDTDIQVYQNILNTYASDTSYSMVTNSSLIHDSLRYLYINLLNTCTLILLLFVIFITFTYQNSMIYLTCFRKMLAIKIFHGYSFHEKYKYLYYQSIATTFVPVYAYSLLCGQFSLHVIIYSIVISCLELVVITFMLRSFEKKGIVEILKGE